MRHLDEATIALLADHEGSADQVAHLTECAACSGRLAYYRKQAAALRGLSDLQAPAAGWDRLAAAMNQGTVVQSIQVAPGRRPYAFRIAQIAAAIAIFTAGALVGAQRTSSDASRSGLAMAPPADTLPATTDTTLALTVRVAALEAMVLTAEAALVEAPADPVIRSHYIDVRRDRDLLLSQLPVVSRNAQWF